MKMKRKGFGSPIDSLICAAVFLGVFILWRFFFQWVNPQGNFIFNFVVTFVVTFLTFIVALVVGFNWKKKI